METIKKLTSIFIMALIIILPLYSIIGVGTRVDEIKKLAPADIAKRGWTIMRYEGYQWGSWSNHGGKCWYHVCNTNNPDIQYRVYISLWNGELQYYYGQPEKLSRIDINLDN